MNSLFKIINTKNTSNNNASSGFTIVELIVTIVVLVTLVTIATLSYMGQQQQTRDSVRKTQTAVVAEAIEKYYEANNEYPSVASLAGKSLAEVKAKLKITDEKVLAFPQTNGATTPPIAKESDGVNSTRLVYIGTASGAETHNVKPTLMAIANHTG